MRLPHRRDLTFYAVTLDPDGRPMATPYTSALTGSATYALAQLRYAFSDSRVRPYVAGAIGVMRYSGNGWGAVFPPVEGVVRPTGGITATARAMSGTVGLDAFVTRRVSFGPYFSLLLANTGETGTKNALHGGVRATFAW
jgi:hypothetical protein